MIKLNLRLSKGSYHLATSRIASSYAANPRFLRFYSDDKYKSIEDFKKQKKEYLFGHNFSSIDEIDNQHQKQFSSERHSDTSDLHGKMHSRYGELNESDINSMIEKDPRLINLKPGSVEYKYQQDLIHKEFEKKEKKKQARYEFIERFKGVGLGLVAIVAIISAHQIFMNYEYIKNKITHGSTYNVDDSKIKNLGDPSKNSKSIDYLTNKLINELNQVIIHNLEKLSEIPGLYVFGSHNGQKLPIRFKFFDNMLIQDVKIKLDYLVVIDEKGRLYQYYKDLKEPILTNLPSKVSKCQISNSMIYLLTTKGEVIYTPRLDKPNASFEYSKSRNLLGISTKKPYNKVKFIKNDDSKEALLERNESISDIATGNNHLLMLSNKGRLFIANTALDLENFANFGQFGLPALSPFADYSNQIPNNQAFELTLLNNEIITNKDGTKDIRPRSFGAIAAGKFHNIVSDTSGNIWTWGKNTLGECGTDISYKTDIQPIPKLILSPKNFSAISNVLLPKTDPKNWVVEEVYAANDSSYIKLNYIDKDAEHTEQNVLFSFGNGIKGQLGSSRFMHVCPQPQIIKSINNLREYNEASGQVTNIGVKDVSIGNDHGFVTLDNAGQFKDVLSFGDNEFGQLGNGKVAKSSKLVQLPKLIEPEDFEGYANEKTKDRTLYKKLAKKINDVTTNRLQLLDGVNLSKNGKIEQVIHAGENCSVIFYKRK